MNRIGLLLSFLTGLVICTLVGCSLLPEIRVFQKAVPSDAKATEKPAAQIEGEKKGAAFIREATKPPVGNPAKTVEEVHEVATALSASLGEPAKPVSAEDKDAIIASLRDGLKAKDAQLEKWRAFGRKYGGTELEGTGIDLASFLGVGGLLGVIALCVFVPGFGWVLLRLVPVLWGSLKKIAVSVDALKVTEPDAAKTLLPIFSGQMDGLHKQVIRRVRKGITAEQIENAAAT